MGIFDRESNAATMERQKGEPASTESGGMPGSTYAVSQATRPTAAAPPPAAVQPRKISSKPVFKVRWTNPEGEVVSEYMQALSSTGRSMGTLHIAKPDGWPAGTYRLEFLLNDAPAATMDFEVK